MTKRKQVKEEVAINTINTILRSGRTVTRVVYNGQPSKSRYVMIEYTEPRTLNLG